MKSSPNFVVKERDELKISLLYGSYLFTKRQTKEFFVSPANSSLVGTLITIDHVTDIFAIV